MAKVIKHFLNTNCLIRYTEPMNLLCYFDRHKWNDHGKCKRCGYIVGIEL